MLLDLLGFAGNVLDTPGGMIRDSLAGRNPFENIFRPEERTTGRGLLEMLGLVGSNQEGLDAGDVGGFGVEMLLDPVNALGGFALRGTAKAAQAAKKSNALSEALRAQGAMPEEIAKLTKVVDETGQPRRLYHGTASVFDGPYDMSKADPTALYGRGIYTTSDPALASEYTEKGVRHLRDYQNLESQANQIKRHLPDLAERAAAEPDAIWPKTLASNQRRLTQLEKMMKDHPMDQMGVRMHFMDARNPLDMDSPVPMELLQTLDAPEALLRIAATRIPQKMSDLPPEIASTLSEKRVPESLIRSLSNAIRQHGSGGQYFDDQVFGLQQFLGPEGAQRVVDAMVPPPTTMEALARHPPTGDELWNYLGATGDQRNAILKQSGIDAFRHTGGNIMGDGRLHDVFIALDPSQIYNPYIAPEMQDAPSMSPLLAALLGHNAIARPEWN